MTTPEVDDWIDKIEARGKVASKRQFPPTWADVTRLIVEVRALQSALDESESLLDDAGDILSALLTEQPPSEEGAEAHDQWSQTRMEALHAAEDLLATLEGDDDDDDDEAEKV